MKRFDYYALVLILLIGAAYCFHLERELEAGIFLGLFFEYARSVLGLGKRSENIVEKKDTEIESVLRDISSSL